GPRSRSSGQRPAIGPSDLQTIGSYLLGFHFVCLHRFQVVQAFQECLAKHSCPLISFTLLERSMINSQSELTRLLGSVVSLDFLVRRAIGPKEHRNEDPFL